MYSRLSLKYYARKRVLRGRDSEKSRDNQRTLISELSHLKRLSHRHLVKIITSYTDPEYISYIMEPVAELDLERLLAMRGHSAPVDQDQSALRRFFGCLAGAVNYLHQSKIRHRDITARNILIYHDEVYISDFGSAYNWSNRSVSATRHHNPPVSPDYQAPEIAKREERDSKSDMFSLGVVFLEITTTLLGRSTAELKREITMNARKQNSDQPYVYANLPVVLTWLDGLMKANTVEHDNEPLVWVRDLLQEKPRNRPSAKGLMKDILESPSFRSFCCFKCQRDFEERAFEYDAGMQRDDLLEDSTATKDMVAKMFGEEASSSVNGVSARKSDSVERWLGVTRLDNGEAVPIPGAFPDVQDAHAGSGRGVDDNNSPLSATHAQDWCLSSEVYEGDRWYTQSILAREPGERGIQFYHNTTSPDGNSESAAVDPAVSDHERNLRDTGLGFMEYGSSDSDEDAEHQLFEEYSDPSDTSSESESASDTHLASGIHSSIKELGIIVEVDEIQSEAGASEEDRNNGYHFKEVSDESTIDEKTQTLGEDLRRIKSEPMDDSLDSPYPISQALNEVQLPFPVVAGYIESPCAGMNLAELTTKGPKAVTCEDAPENAMSDTPQFLSHSTPDSGSALIEWPTEPDMDQQGMSTPDDSNKTQEQLETILERNAENVSRSSEHDGGTASPSSTTAQVIPSEGQIEFGNAVITSQDQTLDLSSSAGMSDVHGCHTNIGSFFGETDKAVRFALPPPSTPQTTELALSLTGLATGASSQESSLLPISDDVKGIPPHSTTKSQPPQLEQASATEQNLRRPPLDGANTKTVIKTPKGPWDRLSRRQLTAKTTKDGLWESELIACASRPPAEQKEPRDYISTPPDQYSHGIPGKSDENSGLRTVQDSRTFFETKIRGVFSQELPPPPALPQKHKTLKAPLSKANLLALDTDNASEETQSGQPTRSTSVPRLPLTAANVKALGMLKLVLFLLEMRAP